MERYLIFAVLFFIFGLRSSLLGLSGAQAACVHVENDDLIEYSCKGGSSEDLQKIPNKVAKIRISHMTVERLVESLFSRFAGSMIILSCSHCMISEIENNSFHKLVNLQQLILDNNQLTEVRGVWFEGLRFLTYLDLNYNRIEYVDGEVFRHAPELIDIRLSGNMLVCLDIESINSLQNLKRIFLNENPSFSCPNAISKVLKERRIDFEVDPRWNDLHIDKIQVSGSKIEDLELNNETNFNQTTTSVAVRELESDPEQPYMLTTSNTSTARMILKSSTMERSKEKYQSKISETTQSYMPEGFIFQEPYLTSVINKNSQEQFVDNYKTTEEVKMLWNINANSPISTTIGNMWKSEELRVNSTVSPNIFVHLYSERTTSNRATQSPGNLAFTYKLLLAIMFTVSVIYEMKFKFVMQ